MIIELICTFSFSEMFILDTGQVKNSKKSKFYYEEYKDRKHKILDSIDKKRDTFLIMDFWKLFKVKFVGLSNVAFGLESVMKCLSV